MVKPALDSMSSEDPTATIQSCIKTRLDGYQVSSKELTLQQLSTAESELSNAYALVMTVGNMLPIVT